jgi:hypothetical protein
MEFFDVLVNSFQQLLNQMALFLPKLIVAVVIWFLGSYLLKLAIGILKKIDLSGLKIDNVLVSTLIDIIWYLGKLLLILVVLDYLGIGRTIIGAFVNGLAFAIAIALGLSFGKALEPDAKDLVQKIRGHIRRS